MFIFFLFLCGWLSAKPQCVCSACLQLFCLRNKTMGHNSVAFVGWFVRSETVVILPTLWFRAHFQRRHSDSVLLKRICSQISSIMFYTEKKEDSSSSSSSSLKRSFVLKTISFFFFYYFDLMQIQMKSLSCSSVFLPFWWIQRCS